MDHPKKAIKKELNREINKLKNRLTNIFFCYKEVIIYVIILNLITINERDVNA